MKRFLAAALLPLAVALPSGADTVVVLPLAATYVVEGDAFTYSSTGRLIGPYEGDHSANGYDCEMAGSFDGAAVAATFAGDVRCEMTGPLMGMSPWRFTAPVQGSVGDGITAWAGRLDDGHRIVCRGAVAPAHDGHLGGLEVCRIT